MNELHLAVIVGGVLVVTVGLLLAGIRTIAADRSSKAAQAQSEIAVPGQVTESFTAAIDQLGYKNDLEVRLGAIYALGQLAKTSREHHWPIMETLTAYVREHSPAQPRSPTPAEQHSEADELEKGAGETKARSLPLDIRVIMAVLRERRPEHETGDQVLDLSNTFLPGAQLTRANLSEARLDGAVLGAPGTSLFEANLSKASLTGADLRAADLRAADLRKADLNGANLSGAYLNRANLSEADLNRANLNRANLTGANLTGADLSEASLIGAYLSQADLSRANLSDADLNRADLNRASLNGADLSGAIFCNTTMPDGTINDDDCEDGDDQ